MPQAIEINKAQLRSVERVFADVKNGAPRVIVRALNKTISSTKTDISREVRKVVTLKAKDVNKAITTTKPNFNNLSAKITISGSPLPLIAYQNRKTKNNGITVRVRKKGGLEKYPSAFSAQMKSGHVGIFERTKNPSGRRRLGGKASDYKISSSGRVNRLQIDEKAGPSIPAVFQFNAEREVSARASENLQKNLIRETDYLLSKLK